MKNFLTMLLVLILINMIVLTGCSTAKSERSSLPPIDQKTLAQSQNPVSEAEKSGESTPGDEEKVQSAALSTSSRMIIYNVQIYMNVKDLDKSIKDLYVMLKESGGYIISSSIDKNGESYKRGNITIKVPAKTLTEFQNKISQLGQVTNQKQTGQDVTEEFVDQSARLKNMKLEEQKYQDLFKCARTVDDMLKVRKELGRVRGDIESLEGRLEFIKANVAMATIELTMEQKIEGVPKSFWNIGGTFKNAFTALKYMVRGAISIFIYLVIVLLPFAIFILFLINLIKGFRGAGKNDSKNKPEEKSENK